jgi:hypothetical protein
MVCGFCSTEQAGGYCATEKCVNAECGKRLEGGGGAGQARGEAQLWEGGQQGASHGSFSNKNDLRKWKKDQVKEQQGLEKVGSSIAVGVFAWWERHLQRNERLRRCGGEGGQSKLDNGKIKTKSHKDGRVGEEGKLRRETKVEKLAAIKAAKRWTTHGASPE